MNARQSLVVAIALVLGIGVGATMNRSTVAQQQPANAPAIGRYQMNADGNVASLVVMDTATGHCWYWGMRTFKDLKTVFDESGPKAEWHDMGVPADQKQKAAGKD